MGAVDAAVAIEVDVAAAEDAATDTPVPPIRQRKDCVAIWAHMSFDYGSKGAANHVV